MRLRGDSRHLEKLQLDERIYLLMRKVQPDPRAPRPRLNRAMHTPTSRLRSPQI